MEPEQKLIVVSAEVPYKDRDITSHLKAYLEEGWTVAQISIAPGPMTHVSVAVLLTRQRGPHNGNGKKSVRR